MRLIEFLHWFNIICWDMNWFIADMAQFMKGNMLDVGCGDKQVKFSPDRYTGIDVADRKTKADVFGSALDLPFDNEQFDSVACISVLEHVPEPQKAIDEIYRVLKPGGICAFIVPFINRIHLSPNDYFRFTRYGIEYMINKSGLTIIKMKDGGGMWKAIGARISGYLYSDICGMGYAQHDSAGKKRAYLLPVIIPVIVVVVCLTRLLDKLHYINKDTVHYYVLCRKEAYGAQY